MAVKMVREVGGVRERFNKYVSLYLLHISFFNVLNVLVTTVSLYFKLLQDYNELRIMWFSLGHSV